MSKSGRQLSLLLWKNFVLQIRRPVGTTFELLLPVAMISLLIIARIGLRNTESTKCFRTFEHKVAPDFVASIRASRSTNDSIQYLAFYPSNSWTRAIVTNASQLLGLNVQANDTDSTGKSYTSEIDAANEASEFFSKYLGAVIFEHPATEASMPKFINYKIRLSHQLQSQSPNSKRGTWRTSQSYPFFRADGPRSWVNPNYTARFLPLQYAIDTAIIRIQTGDPNATAANSVNQFPFPSYYSDPFISAVRGLMPLLFTLAFIYTAISVIKELVAEKQYRLKESMKMMGLSNWIHWLAWFLKNFLFFLISVILLTILIKVARIFEHSHWSIVFLFLLVYSISTISFCFLVSVFFSHAVRSMLFGAVLWFAIYSPYSVIANPQTYEAMSVTEKSAACLLPNTCLGIGVQIIAKFEELQVGVQWSSIADPPSIDENYSLVGAMLMMLVQSLICGILTWYIEAVFPGEYGVPKPFYFPFTASYWCGTTSTDNLSNDDGDEQHEDVEEESADLATGVSINSLGKVFSSATGKKVAVDGLSLKMYKGQITALLGHNGAGKTTTMSILTGLFPPSSGTAYVGNRSILTEMDKIRDSLGLCPQHNVLFDRLTVREHLKFFTALKGLKGEEADTKISAMLADIQLADKEHAQSSSLSGGMKRKLSCAIALIGDPEVVFLDEPTSGMDPSARRATWDLLQRHRDHKTIVLTTHFMDEADYLGDRIAIMADGRLRCCGSSLFLKKRYGVGYHMTIVKSPQFQENKVVSLIHDLIPTAKQVSNIGAELSYILDNDSSKMFKSLFESLEGDEGAKLGISSFGVSITTLEEVFLKVGEGLDHTEAPKEQENKDTSDVKLLVNVEGDKAELLTGMALGWNHFKAMFIKRFLNSKREKRAVFSQLILPALVTLLGLVLAQTIPAQKDDPPRVLSLGNYVKSGTSGTAYFADFRPNPDSKLWKYASETYKKALLNTEDVKNTSVTIQTNNAAQIYVNGKSHAIGNGYVGCCQFEYIVLNSECKAAIGNNSQLCAKTAPYGYRHCMKCVNNPYASDCPITVGRTELRDKNTYFSEVILEKSTGKKRFFDSSLAGFTIQNTSNGLDVRSWFSNQPLHTVAAAYSAVSSIMLAYRKDDNAYGIRVTNHPLPRNAEELADVAQSNGASITLAIFVTMAICFIAASFITFIVNEKTSKAKHVQFVSGVGPVSYWTATFCWDFINFLVPAVAIIILFAAFNLESYRGDDLGALFLLLLLCGFSMLPFVYCISFLFKNPLIAYSVVSLLLMVLSIAAVIGVFVCRIPSLGYLKEAEIMHNVFLLFPTYGFPQAVMDIATNQASRKACSKSLRSKVTCKIQGIKWEESALAWDYPGSGLTCLYMAIETIVYLLLVLLIEENFFLNRFFKNKKEESTVTDLDNDVREERKRISNLPAEDYANEAVVLKNLTKVYSSSGMVAVDHLTLGIPKKECFGLLGVNGAGKTTTFGMLTGEHAITAGTAYLDGLNIETQLREVQQRIGYCPQFDALIDKLTGREMLQMFARLRGIPAHKIDAIVNATIKQLNLSNWADKMCGNYSGGNKRKLSTAIALVGNPPIIFLDEPTSGMDPASRRFLWNTLSILLNDQRSIVLTSHSMEECEALCTRLVIMVNGKFKCLGSIQHLKSKYGQGFTLMLKIGSKDDGGYGNNNAPRARSAFEDNQAYQGESVAEVPPVNYVSATGGVMFGNPRQIEAMNKVKNFVGKYFEGATIVEERAGMLQYQINDSSLKWSFMFDTLERHAEELEIIDYSLSQTSLEQVFLNFAKDQHSEDRKFQRKCCGCF